MIGHLPSLPLRSVPASNTFICFSMNGPWRCPSYSSSLPNLITTT
jgi:hypothetical protein